MKRLTALLTTVLLALAPLSGAFAAPGGDSKPTGHKKVINSTFGAGPSNTRGVDGRTEYTFDVTPGGAVTDHIAVINYTHQYEQLAVYPVDAVSATNGTISFPGQFAKRQQAGAWMSIGTPGGNGVINIKPRSTDILPIHVKVPMNAPPGDHVGAVVIALTGYAKGRFGQGSIERLKFAQRIGIKAIFRVSGPTHPNLTIRNLKASYSGPIDPFAKGAVKVTYFLHNGGNVVIGGPQKVTIHGLFGSMESATGLAAVPALLPDATYPVSVTIHKVYPEILMSANVTITEQGLPQDIDPGLHPVSSSVHFLAIPWILLLVLLLLIVGLGLKYRQRRKKRRGAQPVARHRADPAPQGANA